METPAKSSKMHIGRKISRIREIRGIKQDYLANELGVSQQTISKIEQSEKIEEEILDKIASILGVTSDVVKNFSEEAMVNYFNTFNDNSFSNAQGTFSPNNCNFNPLEKMVELFEENKKLYERLLKSEQEKIDILKSR